MEIKIRKRTPATFSGSERCGNCSDSCETCGESCGEQCASSSFTSGSQSTVATRHVLSDLADIQVEA